MFSRALKNEVRLYITWNHIFNDKYVSYRPSISEVRLRYVSMDYSTDSYKDWYVSTAIFMINEMGGGMELYQLNWT